MASYGERLPLAIDELSDTDEIELGEAPLVVRDPTTTLDSWIGPELSPSGRPTATLMDQSDLEVTPSGVPRPVRSASPNGRLPTVHDRIESIKAWSISTYKCSRQLIAERMGRSTRTVDAELDSQIMTLRETQAQYRTVMRVAQALSSHLNTMLTTQMKLGELFTQLGQRSPELRDEFGCNANSQRALNEAGKPLLEALAFFTSSIETLCDQTIEDTLISVKQFETARVEYDAYRVDLEWAQQQPTLPPAAVAEAQRQHDARHAQYQRLRDKVTVKLRLLDENRVKVMQNQLILFHLAVNNFFSGNTSALKTTLQHLSATSMGAGDSSSAGHSNAA